MSSETRIYLVTGDPGSGKTTVVSKLLFKVKSEGFTVGGVITREVRSHGERTGFTLLDLSTEESAVLASVEKKPGPRVGKYHIDLKSLSTLAPKALEHARKHSDIIVCDELGPMELFSPEFRRAVNDSILNSSKLSICVVHKRLADPLIEALKQSKEAKIYEVTYENRDNITDEIWMEVLYFLKEKKT